MCAYEPYVDNTIGIVNPHDQSVLVTGYVKHNPFEMEQKGLTAKDLEPMIGKSATEYMKSSIVNAL
jgi:hypothetical protein